MFKVRDVSTKSEYTKWDNNKAHYYGFRFDMHRGGKGRLHMGVGPAGDGAANRRSIFNSLLLAAATETVGSVRQLELLAAG